MKAGLLIIDEISMLDGHIFDKVSHATSLPRQARHCHVTATSASSTRRATLRRRHVIAATSSLTRRR